MSSSLELLAALGLAKSGKEDLEALTVDEVSEKLHEAAAERKLAYEEGEKGAIKAAATRKVKGYIEELKERGVEVDEAEFIPETAVESLTDEQLYELLRESVAVRQAAYDNPESKGTDKSTATKKVGGILGELVGRGAEIETIKQFLADPDAAPPVSAPADASDEEAPTEGPVPPEPEEPAEQPEETPQTRRRRPRPTPQGGAPA